MPEVIRQSIQSISCPNQLSLTIHRHGRGNKNPCLAKSDRTAAHHRAPAEHPERHGRPGRPAGAGQPPPEAFTDIEATQTTTAYCVQRADLVGYQRILTVWRDIQPAASVKRVIGYWFDMLAGIEANTKAVLNMLVSCSRSAASSAEIIETYPPQLKHEVAVEQ